MIRGIAMKKALGVMVAVVCAWQVAGQYHWWAGGEDGVWDTETENWRNDAGDPVMWPDNGSALAVFTNEAPIVVNIPTDGIRVYQIYCNIAKAGITFRGGDIRGLGGSHLEIFTTEAAPLRFESAITEARLNSISMVLQW